MKTTPNLSLPYPELTDTADVPRDIEALAATLDALLGGGGGGGGSGTLPLAAAPVLDVGIPGQVRAGRQLTPADFTSLGLSPPLGLWSLSDLTNQGSDGRPLVNLGVVPFGAGINGVASSCAVFAGSTGQALYVSDSGAADPYRIRTGSWGCWFRTANRAALQFLISKDSTTASNRGWYCVINGTILQVGIPAPDGNASTGLNGVSDIADDRWHLVVGTFDGTTARVYVDAVPEAAGPSAGPMFGGSAPLNIGARGADGSTAAGSPHYGRVDEAFVTADVLTDDQVRLLYATRLAHTLGTIPTTVRLKVHRRRKGAALAVTDFTTQPVRLHNFTGGALTDQGSGGVALTNNGTAIPIGGADGTPQDAFNFSGAQSLSATDAGLPGGLTSRSYGCWFKTTQGTAGARGIIGWGSAGARDLIYNSDGSIATASGSDGIVTAVFIADGAWHHVICTEDNTAGDGVKRKLYLDGRLIGGSTAIGTITLGGASHFRVGSDIDGTLPFTGQIDGAFVTNYALGATEIRNLYAKGVQDLGGSPKNAGDHVERVDAASVLMIADTLESQHTIDLGVVA